MGAINIEYVLISDVFNLYVELSKSMQWHTTQGEREEKPKAMVGKTRLSRRKMCVKYKYNLYDENKRMIFDLSIQSALKNSIIICFSIINYMNNNNNKYNLNNFIAQPEHK